MYATTEKDKEKHPNCDKKCEGLGEPHQEGFGLKKRHGCTDILFLLMFCAAMLAMTAIGLDGAANSNIDALVNPMDYQGRVCGVDAGVANKPAAYVIDTQGTMVCLDKCPTSTDEDGIALAYASPLDYKEDGIDGMYDADLLICKDDYTKDSVAKIVGSGDDFGVATDCMFSVESTEVLSYCIPEISGLSLDANTTTSMMSGNDATNYMMEFVGDIFTAKDWIFGFGFAVALLVGFLFTYVLRIPGLLYTVVWTVIVLVTIMFLFVGSFMYDTYGKWDEAQSRPDYEIQGMKILSYIFFGLAALWIIVMFIMRKRIALAIALTKETAKAIEDLKTVIFLPVIFLAFYIIFAVVWAFYSIFLMSKGKWQLYDATTGNMVDDDDAFPKAGTYGNVTITETWEFETASEKVQYFMLFCYFWGAEFLSAVLQLIMALAFACWYFTKDKANTGMATVKTAFYMGARYHTGTAAAGSLIIAIVKTIRAFVAKLQEQAEKRGGKLAKCILCCIQSCLWCIEKCMKFINKNAYIQTAIYGTTFCTSAKNAFFLIARNIGRIMAVGVVSEVVVFIGKYFIIMVTTAFAYVCMDRVIGDELNSLVGPCIFVAFFAYCIAILFMSVFAMGISTLLQCFIADEEMYPDPVDRYASPELLSFIDSSAAAHAAEAKKKGGGAEEAAKAAASAAAPAEAAPVEGASTEPEQT